MNTPDIPEETIEEAVQHALSSASHFLHAKGYSVGDHLGTLMLPYIFEAVWGRSGVFRVIFFEDMLSPSAAPRFTTIQQPIFDALRQTAASILADPTASQSLDKTPHLIKHLQMIAEGKVPFGWKLLPEGVEI